MNSNRDEIIEKVLCGIPLVADEVARRAASRIELAVRDHL
jgi:hypothetical protein